jgi:DNA-binding NarL/FixJ family response regulator
VPDTIRLVLVEDHVLMREGLIEILETYDDLKVVGTAGNSQNALAVVAEQRPDVVLLDVEIPGGDVTTTVKQIQISSPDTKILILSMYDGPQLVRDLLDLGIKGYLLKNATRHQLVAAVRSSVSDDSGVVLFISRESLAAIQNPDRGPAALSVRERAILELVAQAKSNAQIASHFHCTEATVKRHLRNIFGKLDAVSRIDAVNKAVATAQISPPKPGNTVHPRQR